MKTPNASIMTNFTDLVAISCLQINLNHSKLAQDCIANKIQTLNNKREEFIICIQEPYVYGSKHAKKPKSCNTYCNDNNPLVVLTLRRKQQNNEACRCRKKRGVFGGFAA